MISIQEAKLANVTIGKRGKPLAMIGRTFARLTVVSLAARVQNDAYWLCRCSCGRDTIVNDSSLRSIRTKSCGCYQAEQRPRLSTVHGRYNTPEYITWVNMISRCHNKKHPQYQNYGGRGVYVCKRWRAFINFFQDMGPRPTGLTIERINNNGNYKPGNCVWATVKLQARNRRNNRWIEFDGHRLCLTDFASFVGINLGTVKSRLRYGWSISKIATTPIR